MTKMKYLRKLALNLCIIVAEVTLIWVGYNAFSHHWQPMTGALAVLGNLTLLVLLIHFSRRKGFRWQRPGLFKTTLVVILAVGICTFAGVQPMSAYKDSVASKWGTYWEEEKIRTEERLAQAEIEEQKRIGEQKVAEQEKIVEQKVKEETSKELVHKSKLDIPIALQIHQLVNTERQKRGLLPAKWSDMLTKQAQSQAEHCVEIGYLKHSSRYAFQGGENLVGGTGMFNAQTAVTIWMNSTKGHREYLLSPRVKYAGVGVASKNGVMVAAWAFADMALFTEFSN